MPANLDDLAARIYSRVFGHLDDRRFCAAKTQQIYEWLANGDLPARPNLRELVAEWREYDADEPNLRPVGRPPVAPDLVRKTVTLPRYLVDRLTVLGGGNLSAGIRALAERV